MDKKTNMDYWADVLKNTPDSYKEWFKKERDYLQNIIIKNSIVLEVGCGDGRSILDLLDKTNNITGIDHDEKIVSETQARFVNYPEVEILKADATSLPFLDESFDFVVCMTTFANFADKKFIVIDEMKRVLRPSGKIIISVFSEDAFSERMSLYKSVGVKIKQVKGTTVIFDESLGDNISEQFTKTELESIFLKENLVIEDITKVNIAYLCTLSLKEVFIV